MTVVHINTCSYGSTGRIAVQLCQMVESDGGTAYLCVPNGRHNSKKYEGHHIWIGGRLSEDFHLILSRLTGLSGLFSYFATRRFIAELRQLKPDLIHLHNLHNSYICLPVLFNYLKTEFIPVVWTLHDCWAFTGHCPHFDIAHCEKWKTGCYQCPQYREYPQSYVDQSKRQYGYKKEWFNGVKNLILITPSHWLSGLVKQSFLKSYQSKIISNGIDLHMFRPRKSDFLLRYKSAGKKLVLGVAFDWSYRKGLDVFIDLADRLNNEYQIVLVGTNQIIDRLLPSNIISVHRTQSQKMLAEIYTAADVFVNPTREDNFPTVNLESLACGTPVITFNTGGSPECINDTCGSVISQDDVDALEAEIIRVCTESPFSAEACITRAMKFDINSRFKEYMDLYKRLTGEQT